MTVFILPHEHCKEIRERDENKQIITVRKMSNEMRSWLKHHNIEFSCRFAFIPGRHNGLRGNLMRIHTCELSIPDENDAILFKLTWL